MSAGIDFGKAALTRTSALRDGGTQIIYLISNNTKFCIAYLGGFKYKNTSSYRSIVLSGEDLEQTPLEEKYTDDLERFIGDNKSELPVNIYKAWKSEVTELKNNCG